MLGFSRVFLFKVVALMVFAVGTASLLLLYFMPTPPSTVLTATSQRGGGYEYLGERYRDKLARVGVRLELLHTGGSVENIKLLEDDKSRRQDRLCARRHLEQPTGAKRDVAGPCQLSAVLDFLSRQRTPDAHAAVHKPAHRHRSGRQRHPGRGDGNLWAERHHAPDREVLAARRRGGGQGAEGRQRRCRVPRLFAECSDHSSPDARSRNPFDEHAADRGSDADISASRSVASCRKG